MPTDDRAEEIFNAAREVAPDARGAFLEQACGGDGALQAVVEALLRADAEAGPFLSDSTAGWQARHARRGSLAMHEERPGGMVGAYKLLQLIGEGGFGTVWMAEQQRPVARRVAVKILKPGMDTRQVLARFEAEWHALAMMDHPSIARVLDVGATDSGRPFFAMELVRGEPITAYCDGNKLPVRKRLELLEQVCEAVQHAHTKGIIHRDLKPSNMLVSTQEGHPLVKVIDFGIAKATHVRLTDLTLFTQQRQLMGTPRYMSPEQAEGSLDIDTRSDVYALGAVLYELLTGATPFHGELEHAGYAEIQRVIREVEPLKPSVRLARRVETLQSVAIQRRTRLRRLRILIRGELDWITMKCLEKDRTRRYETARGLAMDIHRYLAGDAVAAAPPSTMYRLAKFARQNKGPVIAAGLVLVALVLGMIGTSIGLAKAWRAEERERARANELLRVEDFQARELEFPDLLRGVDLIAAEKLYGDALAEFEAFLGPGHPRTLSVYFTMGSLLRLEGKFEEAEAYYRQALEGWRDPRRLGEEHPRTLLTKVYLASTLADGAWEAQQQPGAAPEALGSARDRALEAEQLMRECMVARERRIGDSTRDASGDWILLRARSVLAGAMVAEAACNRSAPLEARLGKLEEAEAMLRGVEMEVSEAGGDSEYVPLKQAGISLARLYLLRNDLEPGRGFDARAAEQLRKLEAIRPSRPALRG